MAQNIEDILPLIQSAGLNTQKVTVLNGPTTTINNPIFTGTRSGGATNIVNIAATNSVATITVAQSGATILLTSTIGTLVTLPAPTAGLWYDIVVVNPLTSGTYAIQTNNTSGPYFYGGLIMGIGSTAMFVTNGTAFTGVRMNGTTSGGSVGTIFTVVATSTSAWAISGQVAGSGVQATPFTSG